MQNSQQAIADSFTKLQKVETTISLDNSRSGRSGLDELVPSHYALKVGEIDVMVVSDGVLSLPGAMLGHNVDPTVRGAFDCGPRKAAWEAGALHILKPLESDLRPNSSQLVTQALRTFRNGLA